MMVVASILAASTILMFLIASMPISEIPHCFVPESSPDPRSPRSSSASSKPFFAVLSALRRSLVFWDLLSVKM
jgi:hypothetical protein